MLVSTVRYNRYMIERFTERGFANADPDFHPHDSDKHGFYKLEKNGEFYFAKYSKDDSVRQSSIAVDIWWCQTVQQLREQHGLPIKTPQIIEHGDDWYIAQWIDGQPSALPTDAADSLGTQIDAYALCLASLDAVQPDWIQTPSPPTANSTPYNQPEYRWEKWSQQPLEMGLLHVNDLQDAYQLVEEYRQYLSPHFQHGDFVPWHILVDANQDWWLIDGEHASVEKPRYYDLAYMYSRIFTRLHSAEAAAHLLDNFAHAAATPYEQLYPALLPVMTSRAIGMHFDACNDLYGSDYRDEAKDLLQRCLSRDPTRLLQP